MKNQFKQLFYVIVLSFMYSNFAMAETAKSSIDGLVIKNFVCAAGHQYQGTIVNRTNQSFTKRTILIKVFDKDRDPVGSCKKEITLEPKSGKKFFVSDCNCKNANSVNITIE